MKKQQCCRYEARNVLFSVESEVTGVPGFPWFPHTVLKLGHRATKRQQPQRLSAYVLFLKFRPRLGPIACTCCTYAPMLFASQRARLRAVLTLA